MRYIATLFCAVTIASAPAVSQTRPGDRASVQPPIRACGVLTRDLVAPFTENKKVLDLVPPEEEALGTSGTACEYGAVRLQLFPGRGGKRTVSGKDFQPVSGVGEGGYFRNNRDRYAELIVWTGKHALDLQVTVPAGRTAEALKADVIALANAIIARLP